MHIFDRRTTLSHIKGTVACFNNAKGYGFISRADGADLFCHYSAIQLQGYKTVKEGDEVEFEIVKGDTGRDQAANVTVCKQCAG